MKLAVAYCRVSTSNQAEEKTIELQVQSIEKYAKSNGYEVVKWFSDNGVSGSLEHRPELAKMMDFLERTAQAEVILIYSLSRLARDLYVQEGLIRELSKSNKQIVSLTEPDLGSNDPTRKLFRQVLGAFSEFERSLITLRMKTGRDSAVLNKGNWHGGQLYGYETQKGKLIINTKEAEVVKRIHYLKRYKSLSVYQIAKLLNEEAVPTKRKSKWHANTVKLILTNKIYRGIVKYKEQTIQGKHQRII